VKLDQLKSLLRRRALPELIPVAGVLGAFLIELRHIVNTQWENFFFNNSDMLTLPLVQQSIALKEPFHWVFSSQIFLFPRAFFMYSHLS
jgi:hypothetical protein